MTALPPALMERRDRAAARHDRALERFPDRSSPGFVSEIEAVISELTAVCNALNLQAKPDAEASRCLTWLADACFDRGQGKELTWLEKGRTHYLRAESILGPPTAATLQQHAKLNYNFANTLRGLSQGNDLTLLRDAEERYRAALEVFRKHTPNLIGAAETQLASIIQQRQLAEMAAQRQGELRQLQRIGKQLDDGDTEGARTAFEQHQASTTSLGSFAQGLLQQLPQMAATLGVPEQDLEPVQNEIRSGLAGVGVGADLESMEMFALLKTRYQADLAAGKVSPGLQVRVERVFAQLERLLAEQPHDDLTAMAAWSARLRNAVEAFVAAMTDVSADGPVGRHQRLRKVLVTEMRLPQRSPGETETTHHIFLELAKLEQLLAQASPQRQIELERDHLRPLARHWRQYALRHHLLLTWPNRWLRDGVQVHPNAVAWFGSAERRRTVADLCRERNLRLLDQSAVDPTAAAWTAVRSAAVTVVEFEGPRTAWSEGCYALGLAAATGSPHVVLLPAGAVPPFNLDIPPIHIQHSTDLATQLSERIDAALYDCPAFGAGESTLEATLGLARKVFADDLAGTLFRTLRGEDAKDPIRVFALLAQAVGAAGRSAPMISTPVFPVPYPNPERPSCFHVTQFDRGTEMRFARVGNAIRRACHEAGVEYLHGNEASDRRILRGIWNDLGRSAHVVVDLSKQNPNVAYELGIAHALGRNVLVIGETGSQEQLFPSIGKERVNQYDPEAPEGVVAAATSAFLKAASG